MPPTHTATQQWQSFEIRMRRKRVDRCVLHAAVAIDAGLLDDARAALEEVERLDPHEPAIEPLRARLRTAEALPAEPFTEPATLASPPVDAILDLAVPGTPVLDNLAPDDTPVLDKLAPDSPALEKNAPETPTSRTFPASAAAVLIAISGTAGWFLFSQNAPGDLGLPRADTSSVVYDSKTVHEPPTAPAQPAVTEPAVRIAETAVTAATTSEPAEAPPAPAATEAVGETATDLAPTGTPAPAPTPPPIATPSSAGSNTRAAASTPAPPPSPPADRRAIPSLLEPSPSLPAAAPAAPPVPAPAPVPTVSGTDGVALSGTAVPLTPPDPPAPTPVSTSGPASTAAPTSSPPAGAASSASTTASTLAADESQVRAVLRRYEAAYSALDAAAASAVWPGVNRRALASAFEALSSQNVGLGRCDVRVSGATAQAECKGTARWQPKVGSGPQTAARQWRFDLRNTGGDWIITGATVR